MALHHAGFQLTKLCINPTVGFPELNPWESVDVAAGINIKAALWYGAAFMQDQTKANNCFLTAGAV
ncbi:MAG TPA: hypothetical protein VIG72_11460, partial [Pontibacter sp.]